ncbi:MAG: DUF177 domain-containing protein [Myxococcales bacterium]|nr:DUF177 domain-containing protein [Myxococcales bacterium]
MSTEATPTPAESALLVDLNLLSGTVSSHHLEVDLPKAEVDAILDGTDAKAAAPGRVRLDLQFLGDTSILVRGAVKVRLEVPCARCLEPADVPCVAELCVQAVKGAGAAGVGARRSSDDEDEEVEVDLDAPDVVGYSGHILDLRPLVAEQIAMAVPMRVLCARGEDCRGLCQACGANLNDLSSSASAGCPLCRGEATTPAPAPEENANQAWKAALQALRDREGDS